MCCEVECELWFPGKRTHNFSQRFPGDRVGQMGNVGTDEFRQISLECSCVRDACELRRLAHDDQQF